METASNEKVIPTFRCTRPRCFIIATTRTVIMRIRFRTQKGLLFPTCRCHDSMIQITVFCRVIGFPRLKLKSAFLIGGAEIGYVCGGISAAGQMGVPSSQHLFRGLGREM